MKRALWITCGPRGNAGDALLYEVTKQLFDGLVDLDFRHVSDPVYLRRGDRPTDNVVIGPGGLFVQTNSSRHLHAKLAKQWDRFEPKKFFLWSTGVLEQPTETELAAVRRVTSRAPRIVVRATKEAELLRRIGPVTSPEWAPCASLFTDRLLDVPRTTRDVVVVNLDAFLFTEENVADHPLRRFVAYANALGLDVRSMVNASGDSNRYSLGLFPLVEIDEAPFKAALDPGLPQKEFHRTFNEALAAHPSYGARYTDCRFAFGKRLHGWLPFLAFDRPAAFVGMAARRGMPADYFGDDTFLCAVPRRNPMSRAQLDAMADGMIAKLQDFVDREDALSARVAERREELWVDLRHRAESFADALA
ncbi:polysaccharide pyruvyl transferase family protein [Cellulosimicrobium marinum]|uniref:polysaccharide pyruvyl transferase family protein n=1 Tax=Cellulosimicrobium marinum TaxID=1638992 RepID=UPI001E44E259|nr:polysaccharide pyruvyl transferase family protein [Cellulosimicrobium marinum]MCB7137654.1 polysaccharide pyruvyl transferase family protein [Cellulosimicrobium marinum]